MNADTPQESIAEVETEAAPIVSLPTPPSVDERNIASARDSLARRNAEIVAADRFLGDPENARHLHGLHWFLNTWSEPSIFICQPPAGHAITKGYPGAEDIARRWPGEWRRQSSSSGGKELTAVRSGVPITIACEPVRVTDVVETFTV